ncbi:hypothetical protein CMMCAS05_02830 [Clavibacter michiganensis subsp. michiganensis]|nr:hypothetical protein CMMCAS05_02830 [Clavibacter michiganensis subsp. michiganensis]
MTTRACCGSVPEDDESAAEKPDGMVSVKSYVPSSRPVRASTEETSCQSNEASSSTSFATSVP